MVENLNFFCFESRRCVQCGHYNCQNLVVEDWHIRYAQLFSFLFGFLMGISSVESWRHYQWRTAFNSNNTQCTLDFRKTMTFSCFDQFVKLTWSITIRQLDVSGQENMLNVPFVEITSTGFITDPCPRNRLLWKLALSVSTTRISSDANRGIILLTGIHNRRFMGLWFGVIC